METVTLVRYATGLSLDYPEVGVPESVESRVSFAYAVLAHAVSLKRLSRGAIVRLRCHDQHNVSIRIFSGFRSNMI